MWLNKKDHKDEKARAEAQRQKFITYKRFFKTDEGFEILSDLINRYSLIFSTKPSETLSSDRMLGRNDVIAYILNQTEMPMTQLDKILKGDKT